MNIFCNVVVAWLWPPQQTSFLMHTQLTRSGYEFQNSCSLWKGSLQGRNWVILREGRRYIYNMKDEIIHGPNVKCDVPLFLDMSLAKVWNAGGGRAPPVAPLVAPQVAPLVVLRLVGKVNSTCLKINQNLKVWSFKITQPLTVRHLIRLANYAI